MAYTINFTDSTLKLPFTIPEYKTDGPSAPLNSSLHGGEFNSLTASTSLLILGKGVPEYGDLVQENFIYLLENFASNGTPPVYPTVGQLWYNNSAGILNIYRDGLGWDGVVTILGGGVLSGNLILNGDPTSSLQAATKQYVDSSIAALESSDFTQTQADGLYLHINGGTLSGTLTLSSDPSGLYDAATKQYVDTTIINAINTTVLGEFTQSQADGLYLHINGGTLSGTLTLHADPNNNLEAATKQYVDNSITAAVSVSGISQVFADGRYVQLNGSTMTGSLILNADPITGLGAATKQYVDVSVSTLDTNVTTVLGTKQNNLGFTPVNLAGDTMNGALILNADPTSTLGAVTKQYVDNNLSLYVDTISANLLFLTKSGGTMTGDIVLNSTPTVDPNGAVSKSYVDTSISTVADIKRIVITAGAGQTVFNLPFSYTIGTNHLWVFINGVKAYVTNSYTETTTTQITFTSPLILTGGELVEFLVFGG
jgi:hypothetical protein